MRNIFTKYIKIVTLLAVLIPLFIACSDHADVENNINVESNKVVLQLNLSAQVTTTSTRSISEKIDVIDPEKFKVLVFEVLDNGTEEYRYTARILKHIGTSKYTIEANASVRKEKYRFVVLANVAEQSIREGLLKEDVLNKFTFDLVGKWSTTKGEAKLVPMWGETAEPFIVDRDRYVNVLLHMALARVDIGLNYLNSNSNNESEEVKGLSNFKLTSIRVYRTKNKGYVASLEDKLDSDRNIVKANIPSDAIYNLEDGSFTSNLVEADKMPLLYALNTVDNPKGVDSSIGEIYIPESYVLPKHPLMNEVPCIVIGGYYGEKNITSDSPLETFYRLDFANYKPSTPLIDSYKTILRNHRYRFNIKSINHPGFPDEEQALNSIPTNIEVEVEDWAENLYNFNVQGEYFFSIDKRNIEVPTVDLLEDLEKPIGIDESLKDYVWVKVPYRSNISKDKYLYSWSDSNGKESDQFKFILNDDVLWFGALPNIPKSNSTAILKEKKEVFNLKVLDMVLQLNINQEPSNTIFVLDCAQTKLNGKYRENGVLNYTHTLDVVIRVPVEIKNNAGSVEPYSIDNRLVHIFTKKRKGIFFEYRGKLNEDGISGELKSLNGISFREYKVSLQGYGTPIKDPNDPISPDSSHPDAYLLPLRDLVISNNSVSEFGSGKLGSLFCETNIIFGYRSKRILTIGSNASYRYGYELEPNSGSRAFVDASVNFGIAPNSSVVVAQLPEDYVEPSARNRAFHIEVITRNNGISGTTINHEYLKNKLDVFKPDIILIGYATTFTPEVNALITNYVNKGGVLIMFTEYYPKSSSVNDMVSAVVGAPLKGGNVNIKGNDQLFTLPNDDKDPIISGPFGNLNGKKWGTDGHALYKFDNFNLADTKVYNVAPGTSSACFFHHYGKRTDGSGLEKAFVFLGDGGFISNSKRYIGPEYLGMSVYCPFAINAQYKPIARTNFLFDSKNPGESVYNSQLFGNILAWAIDYAEFKGINKDE